MQFIYYVNAATKRGKQVSAVGRMMSRILGENR